MFGQILPDLVEKLRVEKSATKDSAKGTLSSGPVSLSREASRDAEVTHQYERLDFSPERKTIELIQHCLKSGRARALTSHEMMKLHLLAVEFSHQMQLVSGALSSNKEINAEVMIRDIGKFEETLDLKIDSIIQSLPDLVFIQARMTAVPDSAGNRTVLRGVFSDAPHGIAYEVIVPARITLPEWTNPEWTGPEWAGRVRVFGRVTERPFSEPRRIAVIAFAVF